MALCKYFREGVSECSSEEVTFINKEVQSQTLKIVLSVRWRQTRCT